MSGEREASSTDDRSSYRAPRWRIAAGCFAAVVLLLFCFSASTRSKEPMAPMEARYRFGFGLAGGQIEDYDVAQLRAGWYVNWGAEANPAHPAGLEYAQMVRLHQDNVCGERIRDRDTCPYVEPYTYTLTSPTSEAEIVSIATANPGSLWFVGNEMDRRDWGQYDPYHPGQYTIPPGGQDECLPEVYAEAYHDIYHLIKGADPSAQVAIGGIVQPTPLRLDYLDKVVSAYQSLYGGMIPVDVWNVHNMILQEVSCEAYPLICYGADVPPGSDAISGADYRIQDADNMTIFRQHIEDFRQWMKGYGEQNKPLVVSEYSVLYGESDDPDNDFDYQRVSDYLYATFDYMTTATSSSLGYPADGNRLVQRWAWYSLNDASFEGATTHHHLFDPVTKEITELGIDYGAYPPGCPTGTSFTSRAVTLTVDLQRPNAPSPDPSWAVPVHLSLHPPGDAEAVCHEWDLTLDQSGGWSGELEAYAGLYDVRLKNLHTLRNVRQNVEISMTNAIDMGMLLEGDANDDNYVKGDDFSILRTGYFRHEGQAGFDDRADFDEDGWIKGSDFSLLRTNYWTRGDIVLGSSRAGCAGLSVGDGVTVSVEPRSSSVRLFEIFTVTLQVDAGLQPVDTVDASVTFDPSLLQVRSITGISVPLETELASAFNNTVGTLVHSRGTFAGSAPTGTFSLCSVTLEAKDVSSEAPLTFTELTDAYLLGRSVLGAYGDGTVSIEGCRVLLPVALRYPSSADGLR